MDGVGRGTGLALGVALGRGEGEWRLRGKREEQVRLIGHGAGWRLVDCSTRRDKVAA